MRMPSRGFGCQVPCSIELFLDLVERRCKWVEDLRGEAARAGLPPFSRSQGVFSSCCWSPVAPQAHGDFTFCLWIQGVAFPLFLTLERRSYFLLVALFPLSCSITWLISWLSLLSIYHVPTLISFYLGASWRILFS